MTAKAQSLNLRKLIPARQYDWTVLGEFGLAEKLETAIISVDNDGVKHYDLLRVFQNSKPAYKEHTVEFIASFTFEPGERDSDRNTRKTIGFRLLGKEYSMSLIDFALHLGLIDDDTDLDDYDAYLRLAELEQSTEFNINEFWGTIAMVDYNPRNARETNLKNPFLRIIHRYLTWTLLSHQQDEKINEAQLKAMHLIFQSNDEWNIPYRMATMFVAIRISTWEDLPGGQFVTTIAENLGLLPTIATKGFTPKQATIKGRHVMVTSMILKKEGDDYRLYRDFEKKGDPGTLVVGGNAGASSSRAKRARTSTEGGGGDREIDLKYVVDLLNMHGRYLDEVSQMLMRLDTRSHARYEHPFGTPIPDYYRDGWHLPTPWDVRVQNLHDAADSTQERNDETGDEDDAADDGDNAD